MPLMMSKPLSPRPSARPGTSRRWLVHTSLAVACVAAAGAVLVWPQWIALDGARTALELQLSREKEIADHFETQRAMLDRQRDWQSEGRRVFLTRELGHYARTVQDVAKRGGTTPLKVEVGGPISGRWRRVSLQATDADGIPCAAGDIEPRSLHLILTGRFDNVYRTLAGLCQQQKLFLPERWDLAPGGAGGAAGELRAEVWATVFVVDDPQEKKPVPTLTGKVAAGAPEEVKG